MPSRWRGNGRKLRSSGGQDTSGSDSPTGSFPLLQLPSELIDLVLSFVLDLPTRTRHNYHNPELSVFKTFQSPILQVNRTVRQRGISIIANGWLWISVKTNTRRSAAWLQDVASRHLPALPLSFHKMLGEKLSEPIEISLGDKGSQSMWTRSTKPESRSILVPYSWNVFQLLVIELSAHCDIPVDVFIHIPTFHFAWQRRLVETRILPLLCVLKWPWKLDIKVGTQDSTVTSRAFSAIRDRQNGVSSSNIGKMLGAIHQVYGKNGDGRVT